MDSELSLNERVFPFPDERLSEALTLLRPIHRAIGACGGLIIVGLKHDKITTYHSEVNTWRSFETTESEAPYLFQSKRVLKTLSRLREEWKDAPEWKVLLALWLHPEYYAMPNAKYLDIKGRFPGTPRQ